MDFSYNTWTSVVIQGFQLTRKGPPFFSLEDPESQAKRYIIQLVDLAVTSQ
jgi:hypothetical protein